MSTPGTRRTKACSLFLSISHFALLIKNRKKNENHIVNNQYSARTYVLMMAAQARGATIEFFGSSGHFDKRKKNATLGEKTDFYEDSCLTSKCATTSASLPNSWRPMARLPVASGALGYNSPVDASYLHPLVAMSSVDIDQRKDSIELAKLHLLSSESIIIWTQHTLCNSVLLQRDTRSRQVKRKRCVRLCQQIQLPVLDRVY